MRRPNLRSLPHFQQHDSQDCGPTCLLTAAAFLGLRVDRTRLSEATRQGRDGSSVAGLCDAADSIGLQSSALRIPGDIEPSVIPVPFVAYWNQNHFVVVLKATQKAVWVSDPTAPQLLKMPVSQFKKSWLSDRSPTGEVSGVAILLERDPVFGLSSGPTSFDGGKPPASALPTSVTSALKAQRGALVHLALISVCGMALAAAAPLTIQTLIDGGLGRGDVAMIAAIISVYILLNSGIQALDGLKRWIMFHVTARLHLDMITAFLGHLLALPLIFFERRTTGDLLSRIEDHRRLELFVSNHVIETVVALAMILAYGGVLIYYAAPLGLVFAAGLLFYIGWILLFLGQRRLLDYQRFQEDARARGREVRILDGTLDIKVSASEKARLREWRDTQVRLYGVNAKSMRLEQIQTVGARVVLEITLGMILMIACLRYLDGLLSLGSILAIVMILGQSVGPASRIIQFIQGYQDLSLSLERIAAVTGEPLDEEGLEAAEPLPPTSEICVSNLQYSYSNGASSFALTDIAFDLLPGRTLAVVGESGSGKTTLMKLVLKLYAPTGGEITVGGVPLRRIRGSDWRRQCGVVLQEGGLFDGTIEANLSGGRKASDRAAMWEAARLASIHDFILSLPLGYSTAVGKDGLMLSSGQRQRLLLARAFYKRPALLVLDEATSALDAENEARITENLRVHLPGTTQLIIAHRLSTVRHADEILVLDQGRIVERGSHDELLRVRGRYYALVSSQLQQVA